MIWMGDAAAGDIPSVCRRRHRQPNIDNLNPMRHYGTGWMDRAAGAGRIRRIGLQGDLT